MKFSCHHYFILWKAQEFYGKRTNFIILHNPNSTRIYHFNFFHYLVRHNLIVMLFQTYIYIQHHVILLSISQNTNQQVLVSYAYLQTIVCSSWSSRNLAVLSHCIIYNTYYIVLVTFLLQQCCLTTNSKISSVVQQISISNQGSVVWV